jgi:hypothetical protein
MELQSKSQPNQQSDAYQTTESSQDRAERSRIDAALNAIESAENIGSPGRDFYIIPELSTVDVNLSVAAVLATGTPTLDDHGRGRISLKPIADPYAPVIADIFYKDGKPVKVLIPKNVDRLKKITKGELAVISRFNNAYDKQRPNLDAEEINDLRRRITENAGYDYDSEIGSGFWRACYESELWREEHPLSVFFGLVEKQK